MGGHERTLIADGLMTIPEAADFLRLSRGMIYKLMEQGRLPFVKLGRTRRVPRRAVVDLAAQALEGGQGASAGPSPARDDDG